MGMARVPVLERPRVKKMPWNRWRVYYVTQYNEIYYSDFYTWHEAIRFAMK